MITPDIGTPHSNWLPFTRIKEIELTCFALELGLWVDHTKGNPFVWFKTQDEANAFVELIREATQIEDPAEVRQFGFIRSNGKGFAVYADRVEVESADFKEEVVRIVSEHERKLVEELSQS